MSTVSNSATERQRFLTVGKSRLRYELVVYQIGKNHMVGYLSAKRP